MWRLTAQRRAIADVFVGEHVHLSAEDVHLQAKQALPEISMARVYNTLGELVSMGELKELTHQDGRKRYDPNIETDHHHLVCTQCGAMVDVELEQTPSVPKRKRRGFVIEAVDVVFRGRCSQCAE